MRLSLKNTGFCFFLLCAIQSTYAQTKIRGFVIEQSTKHPLEFASIQLLRLPDSLLVNSTVTDKKGKFSVTVPSGANYILRYSFVGTALQQTPSFLANGAELNRGQLELDIIAKNLNEVLVTGKKITLNSSIDRKVYNVENDVMSKSGSASDMLRNIPSVEVDLDGGVSLRGSSNVIILINGKPSPLMGKSRAEVLQQLPANAIERIEVITNPSARFRPDGSSGIINIVMKKNFRNGFNGGLTANAGNLDRYNGNLSLNYHPQKLNLFGSYSVRKDARKRYNIIDRSYLTGLGTDSSYRQSGYSLTHPVSQIGNAGFDYTFSKKNSFGISGNFYNRDQVKKDITGNVTFTNGSALASQYNRLRYDPENENQWDASGFFQHAFSKEDHEIRVEMNTSRSDEIENNRYTNQYIFPAQGSVLEKTIIQQGDQENQLTIDYSNPLTEDSKLDAGYDGSFNQVDLNFYGANFDVGQDKYITNIQKTNRFIYKESIQAFYATYEKSFEKFGYNAGLRIESANIKGRLVTKDSLVHNDYFKLYPTLHLSYEINDASEVQLNYSMRVHRPEADELNPFPEYQDPRNLRAGNPKLLPETIHSIEAGYKWSNNSFSFVPSLYYRYKQNGFSTVIEKINDSVLLTTSQNLSKDRSAGMELIISAHPVSWFNSSLSGNFFYNQIDASNLGYVGRKNIVSFSANLNSSFIFFKSLMLQVSSNYRAARLTPQGKSYPAFVLNTGLRKDMLKNKMSVTFAASDLFATLRQRVYLHSSYFNQVSINRRDGPILYLGINYRFGVTKKQKEEKLQFDNGQ